jgi:hypothetical protein
MKIIGAIRVIRAIRIIRVIRAIKLGAPCAAATAVGPLRRWLAGPTHQLNVSVSMHVGDIVYCSSLAHGMQVIQCICIVLHSLMKQQNS